MRKKAILSFILLVSVLITACRNTSAGGSSADEGDVVTVEYFCSAGDYYDLLSEEVMAWNAKEGKEQGVRISLLPDLNAYEADLEVLMESGTHYDLADFGDNVSWVEKGWAMDLAGTENEEIRGMIASYEEYFTKGTGVYGDVITGLPLAVSPFKMAVNLDLFEKNGLELPKTWEDAERCAKIITANGGGKEFGFGWSTWSEGWQNYCFRLNYGNAGCSWWDPETASYDFSVASVPAKTIRRMFENGQILGAGECNHDTVSALFAEGKVGMIPWASYSLFASRFPAKCNWTVIDAPRFEQGERDLKGAYRTVVGCGMDAVSYKKADSRKRKAMEEAWLFLNSDELVSKLYSKGALIPVKESVRKETVMSAELKPQWEAYSLLTGYEALPPCPDTAIPLEGDRLYSVFDLYLQGSLSFEEAVTDLNARYNAAYRALKESGDLDVSIYEK